MTFLESLAIKVAEYLTTGVLGAVGTRTRRLFAGTEEGQALQRCFAHASTALFEHVTFPNPDDAAAIHSLFLSFAGDEEVAIELAELLEGRTPDLSVLDRRFRRAGYEHEVGLAPGFAAFQEAFVRTAKGEAALQKRIIIGQLEQQTDELVHQTGLLASINGSLRRELLDAYVFQTLGEVAGEGAGMAVRLQPPQAAQGTRLPEHSLTYI